MARVLIADDEPHIRAVVSQVCRLDGHLPHEARDADGTVEAFLSQPPDLLVLDLSMPGADGFDVLARLHASGTASECPVVVVTGYSDVELPGPELWAFPVHLLQKPFDVGALRGLIRRALGGQPVGG